MLPLRSFPTNVSTSLIVSIEESIVQPMSCRLSATDVALAQTEEYGTTLEEEVTILTIHSLLHLCGYDHIEDDDYEIMHALEEKLMREWNESRA